jgi:hypothetical protein
MSTNLKMLVLPAVLLGFLAAGCGRGTTDEPSTQDRFKQALAYSECMRTNGVANYPDPELQSNGLKIKVPKSTPEMEKAKAACRDKEPQGEVDAAGGGTVDAAKLTDWTKCMRAKLPKFPDPEVSGGTVTVTLQGTGLKSDSAEFENARRDCDAQSPGGNLRVVNQR